MSTLSKLLIVLVAVLVLLQTAATVVFVHRVDVAVGEKSAADAKAQTYEARAGALQSELANATAAEGTLHQQTQAQITALQQQLLATEQSKAELLVQIAKLNSSTTVQSADLSRLTAALQAAQETQNKLNDSLAMLRKMNEEGTKKVTDLNYANGDLTNRLEVTERERRYLQEQNVELQNQASKASTTMPASGMSMAVPSAKAPAINATVRATSSIANIPYATISAGSADRVSVGMTFTLIDGQGNFLGYLMIDQVDTNEAAGRLTGPRVADVKPGVDAKTKL